MSKAKLVSVIVPVYNVAEYLPSCIQSILNQTFKDYELLLVDDGSTDNSGDICDSYQSKYPDKVSVIHKLNGGLSDARNVGIASSTGKFISLIDADDYICPNMLEVLMNLIRKEDADIAACKYASVVEDNQFPQNTKSKIKIVTGEDSVYGIYRVLYPQIDFVAWNKVYKRELFVENNIIYPVGKYHEDEYTTHKLLSASKKVVITDQELYCYRYRENSIVNTPNTKKVFDYLEGLEETMLEYMNSQKLFGCSLFRYMVVLYSSRKKFGINTKERFLINQKMNQYIHFVLHQNMYKYKIKWGLIMTAFEAKVELFVLRNKFKMG